MQISPPNNDRFLEAVCRFWGKHEPIDSAMLRDPNFLTFCDAHRITLQLAQDPNSPPLTEPHVVQSLFQQQIAQLKLIRALVTIQTTFQEAGIRCIHLKGPVLSQILYGKPEIRQSKDLDIWVDPQQLDAATELLKNLGFESKTNWKSPKQKQAILKHFHSLEFVHPKSDEHIELHWRIPELPQLDFQHAPVQEVYISENRFLCLDSQMLYTYLCKHGAKHAYYRLLWLTDIWKLRQKHADLRAQTTQPTWLLSRLQLETGSIGRPSTIEKESFNEISDHVCLFIHEHNFRARWQKLLRYHRLNFILGGFKGLLSSLVGRNVRPDNWRFLVFPDRIFFLNHLFSRLIWFIRLIFRR